MREVQCSSRPRPSRALTVAGVGLVAGPLLFLITWWLAGPGLGATNVGEATGAGAALACTIWIAVWWMTEAIPVALTSLLPLVLFPLTGLASPPSVAKAYGDDVVFLFLGGLLLAQCMVDTGLHRRIAMGIVAAFGRRPRRLVLGLMVATAGLSMWLSNTATAVMMLPVALAIVGASGKSMGERDAPFAVAAVLGIAFAANIGGLGTPIGSPPAALFQSVYRSKTGLEFGFAQWMLYGVPLIVVLLPITWWWLTRDLEDTEIPAAETAPEKTPLCSAERWTASVCASAACLWVTRTGLGPIQGWGPFAESHGIMATDATVAVAAVILLASISAIRGLGILNWESTVRVLPWGVLLLMGAGFAISDTFDRSGLTAWMGGGIARLSHADVPNALLFPLVLSGVVALSLVVTEFASNTASASLLLPVVFSAAIAAPEGAVPPDLAMIGCALAATTGFALPAGTPPNALAFATGRVSIRRFARMGIGVDLISGALIVTLLVLVYLFR